MDAEGRAMQERLPRTTKYQNFRLADMDVGTSAIAGRESGVINMLSLPQNRSLNYEDWYKNINRPVKVDSILPRKR
jgi:hypothetical protein